MTCAHAVSVGFKKIDGVESAEIGLQRGRGLVKLRPGNRARIEDFWSVVWGNGNKPKETRVTAIGDVVERGGKRYFRMTPGDGNYPVEGVPVKPGRARITGVLQPPKDKRSVVPIRVEQWEPL